MTNLVVTPSTPTLPKITGLSSQAHDADRVNIFIDGRYALSLFLYQVVELGVKVDQEVDETRLTKLKQAEQLGKVYRQALEYALLRPRSRKEMSDYLHRKALTSKAKNQSAKPIIDATIIQKTLDQLVQKGYVNDENFARFWVDNRMVKKGISARKLKAELVKKGIATDTIDQVLTGSRRGDSSEIQKIIAKKRPRYDDQKLFAYLIRQGFNYDDVRSALFDKD
jgi:regulatory protein